MQAVAARLLPLLRILVAAAISIEGGAQIAIIDSSPGWDDAGITAGLLVVIAGLASVIGGRHRWLWAIFTGLWIPLFEIPPTGSWAPLMAFVFAGIGSTVGWLVDRRLRRSS
jgi:hypothetical protein